MIKVALFLLLGACSTTRITYEIEESSARYTREPTVSQPPSPAPELTAPATPLPAERAPDIQSVRATVTDDYPETVTKALYMAIDPVNVRDFPSMHGKVISTLQPGETVIGREIEGSWIRVYDSGYTSVRHLQRID